MKINLKLVSLPICFVGIYITTGCTPVQNPPLPSDPGDSGNLFDPVFSDSACGTAAKKLWENEYQGRITATGAQYRFISGRALDCDEKINDYDFEISCGGIAKKRYVNCHIRASSEGRTNPRLDFTRANECYENARDFALSIDSPPCL